MGLIDSIRDYRIWNQQIKEPHIGNEELIQQHTRMLKYDIFKSTLKTAGYVVLSTAIFFGTLKIFNDDKYNLQQKIAFEKSDYNKNGKLDNEIEWNTFFKEGGHLAIR